VGKKKEKELNEQREKFLHGAVSRGMPQERAEEVFRWILDFANYGFNKAHSAAYAVITCQTAYLKAYYPVEYMAASLSVERNNPEKVGLYVGECRRLGIPILPPDVNRSGIDFTIELLDSPTPSAQHGLGKTAIRYGLGAIKNVGQGAVELILQAREQRGPFKNLTDFSQRVDLKKRARVSDQGRGSCPLWRAAQVTGIGGSNDEALRAVPSGQYHRAAWL